MDAEDEVSISQSLDRKIRLKEILDAQQELDKDLPKYEAEAALSTICNMIEKSDQIINEGDVKERAQHTTEVVMDAHVLKVNHELVSKVLQQNMEFNEKSYLNAIRSVVYQTAVPDWNVFSVIVCKAARTINLQSTMLGAVEVEFKVPVAKQRQQRRRNAIGEEKRPETVSKLKRQDKGAEKVNMVQRQLAGIFRQYNADTMPFYKLVVDPRNFMNTVDNAFQLAFLARDGVIAIDVDQDGQPAVRLVSSAENKKQMETSQWICSLDKKKCEEMARLHKIKEPLIKIQLADFDDDDGGEEFICTED